MRLLGLFCLFLWSILALHGQDLVQAEYFYDHDPGVGQGTSFVITATPGIDEVLSFPSTGLAPGFHLLYIRFLNASGTWTHSQSRAIYIESSIGLETVQKDLTAIEYFFNNDPGVGNGTVVEVASVALHDAQVNIPTEVLDPGFNLLYFRYRNADGLWSQSQSRAIYVESSAVISANLSNLVAYEYFYNTDPGVGKGTVVNVAKGPSFESTLVVEGESLPRGFSLLYLRFQNQEGIWSHSQSRAIFVESLSALSNDNANLDSYEYFFDVDPGFGRGQLVSISGANAFENQLAITLPASLPSGFHQLFIRFKNENMQWSAVQTRPFYLEPALHQGEISPIIAGEYFIDSDPGLGQGINLEGLEGEVRHVYSVPTLTLANGDHKLFVRVRNAQGQWSLLIRDDFTICNDVLSIPEVLGANSICKGEMVTFEASPVAGATSYYWRGPDGFTSTDQVISFEAQTNREGLYQVWAVRGPDVCDSSQVQSAELVVFDQPDLQLTTTSIEVCDTEFVDLTILFSDNNNTDGTVSYFSEESLQQAVSEPESVGVSGDYFIVKNTANGCSHVASVSLNFVHCKVTQELTFPPLAAMNYGDEPIGLQASATSGLPVIYSSSNTSVAVVEGNVLTITGAGITTITAIQLGNEDFYEATSLSETLVVNKANQNIAFEELSVYVFADQYLDLEGIASSGLPVAYSSSNTGVAVISGNRVNIVGVGLSNITANQSGNDNYHPAEAVDQWLSVYRTPQTISFGELEERSFGDASFDLTATASSGLQVFYESSDSDVAVVFGSTVSIVGQGSTQITARQPGNDYFDVAQSITRTLIVGKSSQQITFDVIADRFVGDPDFQLNAQSTSGLSITYTSSNSAVATISGNVVTIHGYGSTQITAHQPGDTNYRSAEVVVQTLTVKRKQQSIIFNDPGSHFLSDGSIGLGGFASSGLEVAYSSSNAQVATVNGSVAILTGIGSTVITATQEGNYEYEAAVAVSKTLVVDPDVILSHKKEIFSIYPNPVSDKLHIRLSKASGTAIVEVYLYSLSGEQVLSVKFDGDAFDLNLSKVPTGIYMLRLVGSGEMIDHKIVVHK